MQIEKLAGRERAAQPPKRPRRISNRRIDRAEQPRRMRTTNCIRQPNPPSGRTWVRLNNLSSFTSDAEVAWEFGSHVWQVHVPLAKILFFSGLLPRHLLEGEAEFLVLGGDYHVKPLRF